KYKTKINRKFRQEGSPKYVFAELEKEKREQEIEEEESSDIEIDSSSSISCSRFSFSNSAKEKREQEIKEEESSDIEIVRTKRFDLKPMDSEEAVLQMDMLGHQFFVFTNAESNETNVVYKRRD